MSTIDLTTILSNISQSLLSIQSLVLGFGFLLGIILVIKGIVKFTKINKQSQEGPATPIAYILGGAALIYFPSSIDVLSNTFFGSNSILQYTPYRAFNLYDSMGVMLQTAGAIWFVRGAVLLVHASEPGKQEGSKGMFFVIGAILAMNFKFTVSSFNSIFQYFISMSSSLF